MIASLGSDVNLNRWSCLLGKPMVLLGRRVWGSGLSDLCSNWSWLVGWDYTHSRSPSCDPFCLAPWIESRTSGSSAQPRTIETVNVTNGYKHGRYYACGVVLEPAEALDLRRWPKGLQVWGRKLIIYGLKLLQRAPLCTALPGHLRWWKMAPIIMLTAYYTRFEFILFQIAVWPFVCVLSLSVSAVYFDNFHFWVWWAPWKL